MYSADPLIFTPLLDTPRRKTGQDAYAITITLLMNSEGNKMGKTAKGTVWLDPNKTTPFESYQYWRNIDDADVMKCLRILTFIPVEELLEIERWEDVNKKKELLAYDLTAIVHGDEEAKKAETTARALFSGEGDDANMPTTVLTEIDDTGIPVLDLMVICRLSSSKGDARRLIQQGGVTINGEKVDSVDLVIDKASLRNGVKIRKGKRYSIKHCLSKISYL